MDRIVLKWKRAHSFVKAQKALRTEFEFQGRKRLFGLPCVYLLTDPTEEIVLRVGQSGDLWEEYKGSKYMIEAALYGSGNLVFVAEAPADERERLWWSVCSSHATIRSSMSNDRCRIATSSCSTRVKSRGLSGQLLPKQDLRTETAGAVAAPSSEITEARHDLPRTCTARCGTTRRHR